MKKTGWKKVLAWLLIGVTLVLPGCSGQSGNDTADTDSQGQNASSDRKKIMGRYVEQEITLPPEIAAAGEYAIVTMQALEDGSLALFEASAGLYISADGGETWEKKETPWLSELEDVYISHMALAPDGSAAVIYSDLQEVTEGVYSARYLYADADGTTRELSYTDAEDELHQLWFGKDSRLYGYTYGGKVYEIDVEKGSIKFLFDTEGLADYVCFTKNRMIVIASRGVTVYDLEEGQTKADEVLQSFVVEKTGGTIGSDTGSHLVAADAGEEADVVYLVLEDGIYRHVIGGTVMEQVADGSINSLGDPQMSIQGFAALSDNKFAVLYDEARLYRYVYDASVPAVPEEQLSIYSLEEDYTVRQAVSMFQKQNPGVYIRYEVGMTGDDGVTAEDAIKNLNTKILSGNGPDLIVLDGLPRKSYEQKGILGDLTEIEKELTGEKSLFPNLVDAFRKEEGLYCLPVRFRIPLLVGPDAVTDKVSDLSGLADAVEQLRKENPSGEITGLFTEEQVLSVLGLSSSAAWLDEKGEIDEKELADFLTQAKRIYQAEIAGYDETELQEKIEESVNMSGQYADLVGEEDLESASGEALGIAMGLQRLGLGALCRIDSDFDIIGTLENQETDFGWQLWQGQMQKGFLPSTCLAISSGSMDKELAVQFFRFFFDRELQDLELPSGLPVNQASFDSLNQKSEEDDETITGLMAEGADGEIFSLEIKDASEEQFERLKSMAQSLENPCISDSIIKKTVLESGAEALNGNVSVEEAVAEIVKKAAIYLAE